VALKFLKNAADEFNHVSISDLIHDRLDRFNDPHSVSGLLHASSLTREDFCPRKVALIRKLGVKLPKEYIDGSLRVTFDEGRASQDLLNNLWLRDIMYGEWQCLTCGDSRVGFAPASKHCDNQKMPCHYRYREMNFVSSELRVTGGIDGLIHPKPGPLVVIEAKIIGASQFPKIETAKMPLAEHSQRTRLYLYLVEQSQKENQLPMSIDTQRGFVVYKLRGHGKMDATKKRISPFRDFPVERNDSMIQREIGFAKQVKAFEDSDRTEFPPGVCETPMDKRAKNCPVAAECFSGKHKTQEAV